MACETMAFTPVADRVHGISVQDVLALSISIASIYTAFSDLICLQKMLTFSTTKKSHNFLN
jgi:hypothetical protein